jgi:hypothetical protein
MFTLVNPLQEIKHAKLQKQKMSATSSYDNDDNDRKVLTIVEVILVDLVENPDDIQTAVECLSPDGKEKGENHN